jgi:hypothetical protein
VIIVSSSGFYVAEFTGRPSPRKPRAYSQ